MNIYQLVQDITPLYNQYKQEKKSMTGSEALEIMWDIGSILKIFIDQNKVAPHALYREIYGKGEGSDNIAKNTWITREFQGRCYRINNMFSSKAVIREEFPNLKSFTLFRESMPFFDNKKFKLKGIERLDLLKLLNSNKSHKYIHNEVKKLQKREIGITNSRNQRLIDLEGEKKLFIEFYNFVFNLTKKDNVDVKNQLKDDKLNSRYLIHLANNTNALSEDGLRFSNNEGEIYVQDSLWFRYGLLINDFASQNNAKKIRRFRRLIPPERIVKLADMLFQILSKSKKQ